MRALVYITLLARDTHMVAGASFKKLEALKQNLHKIADAKAAGQPLDFVLDPNGFATPR